MGARLRLVGESDVRALMTPDDALEVARAALLAQAGGRAWVSTPSAMSLDATRVCGPRFKFKAATIADANLSGIRLLSRRDDPEPAANNHTALYDHSSGRLCGLVSETWMSRIRTAAFGVASVEPLVSPGPLTVGLFGAGDIAAEIVPLLAVSLDIAELRVNSRRPDRTRAFAERFRPLLGERIRAEPERRAIVDGADLVITLTEARDPLVEPGWTKPGSVLCTMGSHNEIDFGVLAQTDRLVIDDLDYACEMGDGGAWIRQGRLTREALEARMDAAACDVVAGRRPGRLRASDRVLAIVQGMAIGDVAFAAHVLRKAERNELGTMVDLP